METIKNYLESMFANMPSTPDVLKAKDELFQMMEDKYHELIAEGMNDNEAVGKVIAEFGNLDEIADDLGIENTVNHSENIIKRIINTDEVKTIIADYSKRARYVAMGVFLCIFSVNAPIIGSLADEDGIGVCAMMALIATAVGLFVYSKTFVSDWESMKKGECALDYSALEYVKETEHSTRSNRAMMHTLGIILCAICWLPAVVVDEIHISFLEDLGALLLFVFVGIGVYLIVYFSSVNNTYDRLILMNNPQTVAGYKAKKKGELEYINDNVAKIMSVYWPTVFSLYMIWSFLTFEWYRTWIIWPVAGIISAVVKKNLTK